MDALAQIDWNTLLNGPNPPLVLLLIVAAAVIVVGIVATQWRRVRITEADAGLKLRMIERAETGFYEDVIALLTDFATEVGLDEQESITPARNPYKGLAAFTEPGDVDLNALTGDGRQADIARLGVLLGEMVGRDRSSFVSRMIERAQAGSRSR